jgi:hypothetical protein
VEERYDWKAIVSRLAADYESMFALTAAAPFVSLGSSRMKKPPPSQDDGGGCISSAFSSGLGGVSRLQDHYLI